MESAPEPQASSPLPELKGRRRAKHLFTMGMRALDKRIMREAPFLKYDEGLQYLNRAALVYLTCSRWREAADALLECSRIYLKFLKEEKEAAIYLTQAADATSKFDKNETIKHLKSAIKIYCDIGDFVKAGTLQSEVADMQYELKNFEEAAIAFRRAADFFSNVPDRSDYCLFMAANCFCELKEYRVASDIYVLVAEGCVQSNLRKFNARTMLFNSILCKLDTPAAEDDVDSVQKYDFLLEHCSSFEKIDYSWRGSKESLFVKNIIRCRKAYNIHDFADHLYHWNLVKPLSRPNILIMRSIRDEIQSELDKREAAKQKARMEIEKRVKRAERKRLAKLKKEEDDEENNSDSGSDVSGDSSSEASEKDGDKEVDDEFHPSSESTKLVEALTKDLEVGDDDDKMAAEEEIELPDDLKDKYKSTKIHEKKW
jgi:tetratricopeptide (TPR) repeat protein